MSYFRRGRTNQAISAAKAALSQVFFEHEGITAEELLEEHGIEAQDWKSLAARCLFRANSIEPVGSTYEWQQAVGRILDLELAPYGESRQLSFIAGKLKPKRRGDWNVSASEFIGVDSVGGQLFDGVSVQTVHSVKGETHDTTIFVCPPVAPGREERDCPSVVWWATTESEKEEKRIAYVAMTRAKEKLVVCVHNATYENISQAHPDFLSAFDVMTADEFNTQLADPQIHLS